MITATEVRDHAARISAALDELTIESAREARRVAPAPVVPPVAIFVLGCIDFTLGVDVQTDHPKAYMLGRELGFLIERARRATR